VLVRALATRGFDVLLVSGGAPVKLDLGGARFHQLPAVRARDAVQHLLDAAHVGLRMLLGRQGDTVGGGDMLMDQKALDDLGEAADILRQAVEQHGLDAGVAHVDRRAEAVGVHGNTFSRLSRASVQPRR